MRPGYGEDADPDLTAILGPMCPSCGWRGQHRPAIASAGIKACPQWTEGGDWRAGN